MFSTLRSSEMIPTCFACYVIVLVCSKVLYMSYHFQHASVAENRDDDQQPTEQLSMFEKVKRKRLQEERERLKRITQPSSPGRRVPNETQTQQGTDNAAPKRRFSVAPTSPRWLETDYLVTKRNDLERSSPVGAFVDNSSSVTSMESLPPIGQDGARSPVADCSTTSYVPGVSRSLFEWSERGKNYASSTTVPIQDRVLPAIGSSNSGTVGQNSGSSTSRQPFSFSYQSQPDDTIASRSSRATKDNQNEYSDTYD